MRSARIAAAAALACLMGAGAARAQTAVGDWNGTLVAGPAQSFHLGIHVRKTDAGFAGTLDDTSRGVARLRGPQSEVEILNALQQATPEVRVRVAGAAINRLTRPEIEKQTEHALQKFAPLLEPNPRAIKRFVNAYGMARASNVLAARSRSSAPFRSWLARQISCSCDSRGRRKRA